MNKVIDPKELDGQQVHVRFIHDDMHLFAENGIYRVDGNTAEFVAARAVVEAARYASHCEKTDDLMAEGNAWQDMRAALEAYDAVIKE